jgi:hypothetical protein
MSIALESHAEKCAMKAEKLGIFKGLNLLYIKNSVAEILNNIGSNGIFDEYTKHDITHIDSMLKSLEWIIPDETQDLLTSTEWALLVLSIYFHDMGMLVTKSEYTARNSADSGFKEFCDQVLFSGPEGLDYHSKVEKLPPENQDRYLYQEFVRSKHAERIRAWITKEDIHKLGISEEIISILDEILYPFDKLLRKDLALICESHNYDDLYDTQKYKTKQIYGQHDDEMANIHYCAIILRTADLLHITSDRTPSIQFKLINPTDPLSQQEWAKQRAVRRVLPQINCDKDGKQDETIPKNTVDVHAFFENEDGFFGLTSYLNYAKQQIQKSHEWVSNARNNHIYNHNFPWRYINDSNIEAEGFIKETFQFNIDQAKILDLLTGHTLYNDTNIVLRELIQNSIDAIRLYFFDDDPMDKGEILITWDSLNRLLSVQDNGTGMSQAIINNFLLKVGSSRYQDPEFKKKHPDFNSISRFGIGVLSSFMIADEVDIVTCAEDETKSRRLILRSVHGKYLIRLLEKTSEESLAVAPHGTKISLRIRESIDMEDIIKITKHWTVKPRCKVYIQTNKEDKISVGYENLSDALRDTLRSFSFRYYEGDQKQSNFRRLKFVEKEKNGVNIAYALVYDEYLKEWSFLCPENFGRKTEGKHDLNLGICIEGIRVSTDTPGYYGFPILAIANISGKNAPKTNVARSNLESTSELENCLSTIYSFYAQQITDEIHNLTSEESYSITGATGEVNYLLSPLLGDNRKNTRAINYALLKKAISRIPFIIIEDQNVRTTASISEISKQDVFWTIESPFLDSAESLISQLSTSVSLSMLVNNLNIKTCIIPNNPVIRPRNISNKIKQLLFSGKEIDQISVNEKNNQINLRWVNTTDSPRWINIPDRILKLTQDILESINPGYNKDMNSFTKIPTGIIDTDIPTQFDFFYSNGYLNFTPGTKIAQYIKLLIENYDDDQNTIAKISTTLALFTHFVRIKLKTPTESAVIHKTLNFILGRFEVNSSLLKDNLDYDEILDVTNNTNWTAYNIYLWSRRNRQDFN